ncbi:auxin-responsive protein IAA4-like protein [Cinnamomum micranthum f. kanehirae]|uniref:Auxin-responsive protein n=1 Tax=Cinnamomum micranthum f. kanehirae TaxID=337451 RepID=A0A3S3Q7V6_9MAGN|nr:auxin-responsive protein IAA4-like protein [Cinnamomum micranthum f. kanehirae]
MDATDLNLKLGLPGTDSSEAQTSPAAPAPAIKCNKRTLADAVDDAISNSEVVDAGERDREAPPASKAQVVGWPPIQSYRKNNFQSRKKEADGAGIYVKVSMDGAPYLRKIDLKVYNGYPELLKALGDMFKCFTIGDFSEREGYKGSEYVPTYEDKDGDWMLVGDVPWDMFMSSCKRLRIMKGSEARGLGSCA